MSIKWDPRLSVNNVTIDVEHKLLLSLLNALEVVLRNPHEKESLRFFIDQLHDSALEHFDHEEAIQLKYKFPYYEENKKGHKMLMDELNRIRNEIYKYIERDNITQEEANAMSIKCNGVLRDWLVEHILKSDIKMKGFITDKLI